MYYGFVAFIKRGIKKPHHEGEATNQLLLVMQPAPDIGHKHILLLRRWCEQTTRGR